MGHAQKPYFVFRRNGRVHLNRQGRQFSRLLAAEVCASAVVMLDTPCSDVVLRVLATHSINQFPLHFFSRASSCAITFQLDSTSCCVHVVQKKNVRQIYTHTHTYTHYLSCSDGYAAYLWATWLWQTGILSSCGTVVVVLWTPAAWSQPGQRAAQTLRHVTVTLPCRLVPPPCNT
jgi:hypothetical protein